METVTRRSLLPWVASAALSSRFKTTCCICDWSQGTGGRSSANLVSTSTLLSFILCCTSERVMRTILLRSAGARCGLERREKASRSDTIRPTRVVSLVTWARYLRNSGMRSCGMPSSFNMRCSSMERFSTPGDGVVDFVRHAGGKLPERRQAVALQQLLMRRLELLRAVLHFGLQTLREGVDFLERGAQTVAHRVEGVRQFVQFFAVSGDIERLVEFHLADRLGAFDQLFDRLADESAREEDDEQPDERDFHAR